MLDESKKTNAGAPGAKKLFISELTPGAAVDGVFFLRELAVRKTKNGRAYLALSLSDRSGAVDARIWEGFAATGAAPEPNTFVRVTGRVELYRDRLQLNVQSTEKVAAATIDQRDFLPGSYRDTNELAGFLKYFLTEVFDDDYARLLEVFFGNEEFLGRFYLAPGDIRSHHAYLGGLLEHTVSVTTLCQHTCVQHPRLNSDLLITAALLHDVGKVEEFTYEGRIGYSREGRLLGHVLIGQRMIEEQIRKLGDFPREKELMLVHALISHHGELEWGAPKKPQSAEALVLHHIDNLDAKVKGFLEVVEGRGEVSWPELQNFFRRPLGEPRAADRE